MQLLHVDLHVEFFCNSICFSLFIPRKKLIRFKMVFVFLFKLNRSSTFSLLQCLGSIISSIFTKAKVIYCIL